MPGSVSTALKYDSAAIRITVFNNSASTAFTPAALVVDQHDHDHRRQSGQTPATMPA